MKSLCRMSSKNRPAIIHLKTLIPVCAFMFLLLLAGCGDHIGTKDFDSVPPEKVVSLNVQPGEEEILLSWQNPDDPEFKGVVIRRGTIGNPQSASDPQSAENKIIYVGAGNSFTDTDMADGKKYFYSLFTYDESSNYSLGVSASATFAFKPFTLVALPDTQYYTLDYPDLLTTQTQWIVDNQLTKNIAFVMHEGDMTHKNTTSEWTNASNSFTLLDGVVPYAIVPGNHDTPTSNMNTYFPVSRFSSQTYYGGVYEPDKIDNAYYLFRAGGTDWLVMCLEYDPSDDALAWASEILDLYPDRRVIVLTHYYLTGAGTRSAAGKNIWNKLVKAHSNVSFVFNGHVTDPVASRLVSTGDNGNTVYQMMANYQDMNFGGTGYLRIIEIDRHNRKVSVKTYSAWLAIYMTDDDNQFEFTDVELGPPQ